MFEEITNPPSPRKKQPYSLRLVGYPVPEKVLYVECVCAALIDSRFGPGRTWRLMSNLRFEPELEPSVFYDVTDEGLIPSYSIHSDSEMARRYANAVFRTEIDRLVLDAESTHTHECSHSAQPRGSPIVNEIANSTR